jgi:hypothetical protein
MGCPIGLMVRFRLPATNNEGAMKMSDVKVGMRLRSSLSDVYPDILVTELTERGFKYSHPPFLLGTRIGVTEGGEHYGVDGSALYEQVGE